MEGCRGGGGGGSVVMEVGSGGCGGGSGIVWEVGRGGSGWRWRGGAVVAELVWAAAQAQFPVGGGALLVQAGQHNIITPT